MLQNIYTLAFRPVLSRLTCLSHFYLSHQIRQRSSRHSRRHLTLLIPISLVLTMPARAADVNWDGADGLWSTAANWVGDVLPIATDSVRIKNAGTARIGSGDNFTVASLRVGDTDATGALGLAAGGKLTLTGEAGIGLGTNAVGSLTIDGTGAAAGATLYTGGIVYIGFSGGTGSLDILAGGAMISDSTDIGRFSGAVGTVTVSGAGSTWTVNDQFSIGGFSGDGGTISISDGAEVDADVHFRISASDSSVSINGTGSLFAVSSAGIAGTNSFVSVSDGGRLSLDDIELSSGATLRVGDGDAAGIVDAPIVRLSSGGNLNFNHIDPDYFFTDDGTSGGTAIPITTSGGVVHDGDGTTTLSANNSYSGATTINAGTLLVTGSIANSAATVNTGGTLGGTGTTGPVTVMSSGAVAPGTSAGTLSTGSLVLSTNSFLTFELDTPGTVGAGVNDLIAITGDLTLDGRYSIADLGSLGAGSYTLITYTGTLTDNGMSLFVAPPEYDYNLVVGGGEVVLEVSIPLPDFSKTFTPDTVAVDAISTLSFTIDNSASSFAATALDFTDSLPAGLVIATPANAASTCTGGTLTAVAGAGTTSFSGGSVADGASCTVSVDVISVSAGVHANTSGDLTSSSGNSGTASDSLTVYSAPGFNKAFTPATIVPANSSTLAFTIDNSTSPLAATALDFSDTLPAGLTIATPANAATTCTGGVITAVSGAGVVSYSGGSVNAGESCSVTVDVFSVTPGFLANTSGNLTSSLGDSGAASANLTVSEFPGLSEALEDFVPIELSAHSIRLLAGSEARITVSGGGRSLESLSGAPAVANGELIGNELLIKGLTEGMTELSVTNQYGLRDSIIVNVVAIPGLAVAAEPASATLAQINGGIALFPDGNFFSTASFAAGEAVEIIFQIMPDSAHVGAVADIILALVVSGAEIPVSFMNSEGVLQDYDGTQMPAMLTMALPQQVLIDVTGGIPLALSAEQAGSYALYIGYFLKATGELFYSSEAVVLEVN
mgnify:CR=1 FL=1